MKIKLSELPELGMNKWHVKVDYINSNLKRNEAFFATKQGIWTLNFEQYKLIHADYSLH